MISSYEAGIWSSRGRSSTITWKRRLATAPSPSTTSMMLRKLATSSLLRWSLPDIPKKAQAIRKTAMLLMTVMEYLMAVSPVLSF